MNVISLRLLGCILALSAAMLFAESGRYPDANMNKERTVSVG